MATKTNAARTLDALQIPYELAEYAFTPDDLSAEAAARALGVDVGTVFKTLVVHGDRNGHAFAVLPGDHALDLRAMARQTGDRRVEPVPSSALRSLTGYVRGGVTALAARKDFPVIIDDLADLYETISVSAGQRGLQIRIAPRDFLRATGGRLGDIAREKDRA